MNGLKVLFGFSTTSFLLAILLNQPLHRAFYCFIPFSAYAPIAILEQRWRRNKKAVIADKSDDICELLEDTRVAVNRFEQKLATTTFKKNPYGLN
jgi:hypothetical protein